MGMHSNARIDYFSVAMRDLNCTGHGNGRGDNIMSNNSMTVDCDLGLTARIQANVELISFDSY